MCLISVLKKGTEKHSNKVNAFIQSGFESNRDGSGFMYKRNGTNLVGIKKGFFELKDFLMAYNKMGFTKDDEVVIHHRIATVGRADEFNTHPFYIHKDIDICTKLEGEESLSAMAHNGGFNVNKLKDEGSMVEGYSDTCAYANGHMTINNNLEVLKLNAKLFVKGDNILDWNKVVFLFPDRDMVIIGNFEKDEDYYHSNWGYKQRTHNAGGVELDDWPEDYENESAWIAYFEKREEEKKRLEKARTNTCAIGYNTNNTSNPKSISATTLKKKRGLIGNLPKEPTLKLTDVNEFLTEYDELTYKSYELDNSTISITEDNFRNFYFTPKKQFKNVMGGNYGDLFEIMDYAYENFDNKPAQIRRVTTVRGTNFIAKIEFIEDKFNFIPKKEVLTVYRDFLFLQWSRVPSKKNLKEVFRVINQRLHFKDLDLMSVNTYKQLSTLAWKEYFNQNFSNYLSESFSPFKQTLLITEGNSRHADPISTTLPDTKVETEEEKSDNLLAVEMDEIYHSMYH